MANAETPMSVGDALGASAEPATVTHAGKAFRLGAPTQSAKDRLEKLVAASAISETLALKPFLSTAEFAQVWADVRNSIELRDHATNGPMWLRTMNGPRGMVLFTLSLFREHHPDMSEAQVLELFRTEPEQVEAAVLLMVPGFFALVGREMGASPAQIQAIIDQVIGQLRQRLPKPHSDPSTTFSSSQAATPPGQSTG